MTVIETLWVHEQAAVITAESHDISGFTPSFLLTNDIVPYDWTCWRATRTEDSVEIGIGPTTWRMTESQLWVSVSPDCPFNGEDLDPLEPYFLDPIKRYLDAIPYLPTRHLWFFWSISVTDPKWRQWTEDTFLRNHWPPELGTPMLRPSITSQKGDLTLLMNIKNELTNRAGQPAQDSIVFESYVYRNIYQTPGDIISEIQHWTERLGLLEQSINHLLTEGGSK